MHPIENQYAVKKFWEGLMGEKKDHLKKLSELSKKITALGESLRQAEKDMETTWVNEVEKRDLKELKNRMKAVEEALCVIQEEVGHIEGKHCRQG
jgi:rubrerythrin